MFCLIVNKVYYVLKAFLDTLAEKNIFVQLSSRVIISFLDSSDLDLNEKRDIVKKIFEFEMDAKSKDAIYNYYLNNNNDSKEERMVIVEALMTEGCPISYNTVKNYVVKTVRDEDNKIKIIKLIFDTGINKTYLGDLLSEYLLLSVDEKGVNNEIFDFLISYGFKVDSYVFTKYITVNKDNIDLKIEKAKKLIQNGTHVNPNCLENYILSINSVNVFSEEMFNILSKGAFSISADSYLKYLLSCKDMDKVRHNNKLLDAITLDLKSLYVNFVYSGDCVSGNVLQAYVLSAQDSYDVAKSIISEMLALRIKMNSEITVNGVMTKFKKYVGHKKASLSPLALRICEENKMFSLF